MADNFISETIAAPILNNILSEKENVCECCATMRVEFNNLKLELNSCNEIIRILQEEINKMVVGTKMAEVEISGNQASHMLLESKSINDVNVCSKC
jgi:hypothetical protein